MRGRGLIAILGILLTVSGVALFGYFLWITNLEVAARQRDGRDSLESAGGCLHALQTVVVPKRTPVVGETIVIELVFMNATSEECEVNASLNAAGFDKDPSGGQTFKLKPGVSSEYWTLSAKQAGDHEILVNSDNESRRLGLHVLSNQFFGPTTSLLLSGLLSILGPMTTIPWWLDRRDKRKQSKRQSGEAVT